MKIKWINVLYFTIILLVVTEGTGYLASKIIGVPKLPEVCNKWNEKYIMEITIIISGIISYILYKYLFGSSGGKKMF